MLRRWRVFCLVCGLWITACLVAASEDRMLEDLEEPVDVLGTRDLLFNPERRINIFERQTLPLHITVLLQGTSDNGTSGVVVKVSAADTSVATVSDSQEGVVVQNGTAYNVSIEGVFLGYTHLKFELCSPDDIGGANCTRLRYVVAVLRDPSLLQRIFPYLIGFMVSVNYINMGCQIDLMVVLEVLKKPIPPILGIACQFIFMPLVSYGIGLLLLPNALMRFGIFMLGCSPGGNSSNLWTLMFDGDVTLSITMTFISTIASVGMMPLWIFLLGRHMSPETGSLQIPFANIVASLVGLVVPLAIGMLIWRFKPKWAQKAQKCIKPLTLVVLIVILVLSVTVNQYIFLLMTWKSFLCGALISWSAYAFGAFAAFLGRLNRAQIIAVSIEIAFQNSGIAVVVLFTSLHQPDADLVIVPVVCQAILQGIPLYLLYIVLRLRKCVLNRMHPDKKVEPVPVCEAELGEMCKVPANGRPNENLETNGVLVEDYKSKL
uniref:Putative sodium-bile acid cotransporter n=1 Tax=Ixodes scapularis TaxID=6945 RepID=A0A4D5RL41_IXOSC